MPRDGGGGARWLAAASAVAVADVSHVGWPHTVVVEFAGNGGAMLVGTDGNNMLLGGPGSDTIVAGPGNDILWGDRYPVPAIRPTKPTESMAAGATTGSTRAMASTTFTAAPATTTFSPISVMASSTAAVATTS